MSEARMTGAMRILSGLLQARTGQFLAEGRMWRLETSMKPLMRSHGFQTLEQLVDRLLADGGGDLADEVVNALLNNETSFFRDLQMYQMLTRELLPHIAATKKDKVLRIWCAGGSTGQEAYSIAMVLAKEPELWKGWRIQILSTDISTSAIAKAKAGLYSQMEVQRGLAINDLLRWFEPVDNDWQICEDMRRKVDFRVDNLFECHVPSGHYDLIFCRNVLLYFSAELRVQVFEQLARFAGPDSYLLLGAGETVTGQSHDFCTSPQFKNVYQRSTGQILPFRKDNAA